MNHQHYVPTTGERHGSRTILHQDGYIHGKQVAVQVQCDCGRQDRVAYSALRRGQANCCRACGSGKEQIVIGTSNGKRTILAEVESSKCGNRRVRVFCGGCRTESEMFYYAFKAGLGTKKCRECIKLTRKPKPKTARPGVRTRTRSGLTANELQERRDLIFSLWFGGFQQNEIADLLELSTAAINRIIMGTR